MTGKVDTPTEIRSITCPYCGVGPERYCMGVRKIRKANHLERVKMYRLGEVYALSAPDPGSDRLSMKKVITFADEAVGLATDFFWWIVGLLLCGGAFLVYFLRYREFLFSNKPEPGAINEHPGPPPQSVADVATEDRIRADDS